MILKRPSIFLRNYKQGFLHDVSRYLVHLSKMGSAYLCNLCNVSYSSYHKLSQDQNGPRNPPKVAKITKMAKNGNQSMVPCSKARRSQAKRSHQSRDIYVVCGMQTWQEKCYGLFCLLIVGIKYAYYQRPLIVSIHNLELYQSC